jgi:uncharacterized repeat protein (TIGR01451 family)
VVIASNPGGNTTLVLSGTGTTGNLTITPATVAFGDQLVGATSTERTVTLANTGAAPLDVTALTTASGVFARTATGSCSATLPISIAANSSCTLTYTFTPSEVGAANQVLTVTANAPGSGTITLQGIQGNLTITPATVNFGNQAVGTTSSPQSVTLANNGTASLDVTTLVAATGAFIRSPGSCSTDLPITIPAAGSCTLSYNYAPFAVGAVSQVLTVSANAPGGGAIILQGNGTPAADLSIVKTSNMNLVGLGLVQYTLVVANAGPNPVTSATVTDNFPAVLSNVLWSCVGVSGGVCSANGTGNISRLVDLPVGGSVVFSISANTALPLPVSISNTATVAAPAGVTDPNPNNNTSTVVDVFQIFKNGFEAVTNNPANNPPENTQQLPPLRSGAVASAAVTAEAVQSSLTGPIGVDLLRYWQDGSAVVLQVRQIGSQTQFRVLVGSTRSWQVGAWQALDATRGVRLEWTSAVGAEGRAEITARVIGG